MPAILIASLKTLNLGLGIAFNIANEATLSEEAVELKHKK